MYANNGSNIDFWGNSDHWAAKSSPFREGDFGTKDGAVIGKGGQGELYLVQPCNTASNIAFYWASLRICEYKDWHVPEHTQRSLKRAFAGLAVGSAFMHASTTGLGGQYDNKFIAIIVYIAQ